MDQPIIDKYVIDVENLHHVERGILARLYTRSDASYAEMKDSELMGNAFNYHLRRVLAQGLIVLMPSGRYRLSAMGRLLVDSVSLESMRLKIRPVSGIALLVQSEQVGSLLYRSNRQPLFGYAGLPFGKLRLGDTLQGTFSRMLAKRGLAATDVRNVRSRGAMNIRYYEDGELVCHRLCSLWVADYDGDATVTTTSHGSSLWTKDLAEVSKLLPEVTAAVNWLNQDAAVEIEANLAG